MYFLVDNIRFPAAGIFKLRFRVFMRPQHTEWINTLTSKLEQETVTLPEQLWSSGKPEGPQGAFYVAGIFELQRRATDQNADQQA
ncbi:hypothetical protein N0V85_004823 [Neurospora sp. IMI 360204]|nr:hypothetical protein N0V85_004823 [Neurospora sp. IMI 360204]